MKNLKITVESKKQKPKTKVSLGTGVLVPRLSAV